MGCSTTIKNDSYDFFDNIDKYIKYSDDLVSDGNKLDPADDCDSFSTEYTKDNTDIGKKICEQFIKLCNKLPYLKNSNINDQSYRNDWNFLSYWLNIKLRENELNRTICPNDFYDGMESHCMNTLSRFVSSTNLIYHINEDDLNRMKALYILHNNYSKLDTILNNSTSPKPELLLEPSDICSYTYSSAKYMCDDKYKEYCKQLDKFKTKYEKLFITAKSKGKEFANNFKKITDYDNSNIISTTIIGSAVGLIPLLGILYKFTPMGQMFNSKKWNLSINHDNNIDEIRKTSLIDYENEQLNLKQEKYNIEYHPASIL
ncbi:PIR protein [Plasmodium vivax]|nr:PIR protein [Plasmodium vivax]